MSIFYFPLHYYCSFFLTHPVFPIYVMQSSKMSAVQAYHSFVFLQNCVRHVNAVFIVGFFIPVSSLKVFGHSIHSERKRIYLRDQYMLFKMTPLSYHDYSVSGSSGQQCSGIPLKLLYLFSSILVHHKKHFCKVPNQYRSHMTFSNKIQAKTLTWPDMSFYAR